MIKLIIFDLDGVLINSKDLHYESLNMALSTVGEQYVIGREEHLSTYDGLNTTKKLKMLSDKKGLPVEKHHDIWKKKQEMTLKIIDTFNYDERLRNVLSRLKKE